MRSFCALHMRKAAFLIMLSLLLPSHVIVCLHSTVTPVQVSTIFKSNSSLHMIDIAVDTAGNVLFVSGADNSVCKLTPSTSGYAVLLAGCGTTGTTDGVGSHACFNSPYGIAYDAVRSIAYISDNGNHRIRKLDLNSNNRNNVTTLAGAGSGSSDGVGTAALFSGPTGIVYHPALADGVLYIADEGNCRVRRIIISNASVTTLAIPGGGGGVNPCYYLCITSNGQYLYVTTQNNTAASTSYTIVQISTTSGAVVPIAGGPTGAVNGVGFAARFNYFRGIALNSDESALIIADYWNNLIRRMDLSTKQVTTIAGVTTAGSANGPGSTATFNGPEGAVWYCNASSAQCGFLVVEYGNIDLRFISMERYTMTLSPSMMERSETESCNSSATTLMTSSRTLSVSVSMNTASPTMATSPSVSTLIPSLTVTTSASSSSTLSTTRSPSTTSSRSVHTMSSTKSWSFRHTNSSVSSSLSASTTTTITAATSSFVQTSTTTLSSTQSRSTSTTKSNMRFTATTSVSYSLSATGALSTFSHTCTRHTDSPTSTVFCALIYGPSELTTFTSNLSASVAVALAMQSAGDETTLEIETPIVAFPLSRGAVLLNPALALNLSLTLANSSTSSIIIINSGDQNDEGDDAWVLDSVVLDVLPTTDSSSFPLLTTTVPFTTVRSTHLVAVNDHRQQFVACVLQPPNVSTSVSAARWLPASLSALQSVTLSFRLVLRCPSDSAITRSIAIQVLSPAEDLPLAEQVKTASSVAQYTSLFAVPAAGGAVGRLSSVRTLVACNGDSVVTGILPLSIAAAGCGEEYDDDDDNTVLASARGAVLGNLVLWIASCLLMALMVLGYSGLAHVSRLHAMEALGLPSPLMSLVVVTVPSTVTGSFYLLHSLSSLSLCGVDVLMATIGVSMCVFPTLVLSVLSYVVPQRLVLVRHGKHGAITTTMRGLRVASRARAWKELIFARRVQWVERVASSPQHTQNHHGADGGTKVSVSNQRQQEQQRYHADCWSSCLPDAMPRCLRGATVVLLEYAAAWYACADVSLLTVASVLGAVSTFESAAACRASAIAVLALYAMQLVLCVVVQPFTTMFSHVYTIFTLLLSVAAVGCQVWYLFDSLESGADLDFLNNLLIVAAVCDLLVSGVSSMRTAFDALDGLRACRRHFFVLLLRARRDDTQPPMLLQVHCAEEGLAVVDFSDFVSSENDEELFRDAIDNAEGEGSSATTMMRSSSGIVVGRSDIAPAAAKSAQDPPFAMLPNLSGYGDEVFWDPDGNAAMRRTSSVVVRRHDNEIVVLNNTTEERMLSAEGQERHVHDLPSDHSSSSERIVAQSSLQSSLLDLVPR